MSIFFPLLGCASIATVVGLLLGSTEVEHCRIAPGSLTAVTILYDLSFSYLTVLSLWIYGISPGTVARGGCCARMTVEALFLSPVILFYAWMLAGGHSLSSVSAEVGDSCFTNVSWWSLWILITLTSVSYTISVVWWTRKLADPFFAAKQQLAQNTVSPSRKDKKTEFTPVPPGDDEASGAQTDLSLPKGNRPVYEVADRTELALSNSEDDDITTNASSAPSVAMAITKKASALVSTASTVTLTGASADVHLVDQIQKSLGVGDL